MFYKLGGKEIEFGLLSIQDLIDIQNQLNLDSFVDLFEINKWTQTISGSEKVLFIAGKKTNPTITLDEVRKCGSISSRVKVANDIFVKSVRSGEEDEAEKTI